MLSVACVGSIDGKGGNGPNMNPPGNGNNPPGNGNNPPGNGNNPPGNGNMDPPVGPPPVTPTGKVDSAGPAPVRRLTVAEYNNTVRDLLGIDGPAITATDGFASDVEAFTNGFLKGASIGSSNDVRNYYTLSDKVVTAAMANLATLVPQGCAAPAAGGEQACADKLIDEFGLRAFRRPPNNDEKGDLKALYAKLRGSDVGLNYQEAIKGLISAMMQTPMFTYRWEIGEAPVRDGSLVRLTDYEIASRLSYTIYASMPDTELFTAAREGKLRDANQVAQQVRRLLASDKAKIGLTEFVSQWLRTTALPTLPKDESFTNYSPAVGESMLKETGAFFTALLQGQSSKLETLYTSSTSYVDGPLAKLYGMTNVTGTQLQQVNLNPNQRAGILTHGSILAATSDADEAHPVHRGLEVLEKVLCTVIVPPQDFVPPPVKDVSPTLSNRQRFEEATNGGPSCQGCHVKINGMGFAFENYDAVGGWRDTDAGMPVNASGSFPFSTGEVTYKNAVELTKHIAKSKEARDCFAKQFLEYTLRRPIIDAVEEGSLEGIGKSFADSDYDLKELLVATTKARAFTHRAPLAGEGQQ